MKKFISLIFVSLLFITGSFLFFVLVTSSLVFQSLESVTEAGAPVFNEIQWIPGWKKDIWLMRQSHHGHDIPKNNWDRLAIVIDKTKSPKIAEFYQLESGELAFEPAQAIALKARCFACHANGPRAIHINPLSTYLKPTWSQRVTAGLWNLRIKTYGLVQSQEATHFEEGISFRSQLPLLKKKLALKSCMLCHSEKGLRQPLYFEHIGTIRFLVKNRMMPPFPFQVSSEDEKIIDDMTKD